MPPSSPTAPVIHNSDVGRADTVSVLWLTVADVAGLVQCGPKTVYRAVHRGRLRAARINEKGELRFRPEWVDAWLESVAAPVEIVRNGR